MNFNVVKDKVKIENANIMASGSVNYYEATVAFDETWEGLTAYAVLVPRKNNKTDMQGTSVSVINNRIYIDKDISGVYSIGFVGYRTENNEKVYQISTNLVNISFVKGAGEIETTEKDLPTPSQWEIYIAQIQEMLEGITMIPSGGTIGQALVKKSNTDYDYEWKTVGGGGSGGTTNHAELDNLDYEHSGHTGFQPALVSGQNIKTINGKSILGNGNIEIEGGSGGTSELSPEVKNAILDCFEHVAWVDEHGQDYYDTLEELFFPPKTLVSISALFNQGSTVIYDNTSLDSLKQYLTVTGLYDDESTETIIDYSLSGTLSAGTSIITVTYQSKTTTFAVNVTARAKLSSISAVFTQGQNIIYDNASLDDLKQYLVVTATYTDSSTETVTNYTLSGTLTEGTSTITVTYESKTTTFEVTVTAVPTLSSIEATFTQGGNTIYDDATLDSLKQYLEVVATYSDSSTVTLQDSDYTLSGTLTEGNTTITATYEGKTDTFNVTVTHRLIPSAYQQVEYIASDGNAHFEITNLNYPVGTVYKVKMLQTQRDTANNRVALGCRATDNKYLCVGYKKDANNVGGFFYWDGCWTVLDKAYTEPSTVTMTSTSSSISVTAENTTESQSNTVSTQATVQEVKYLGMFWDDRTANALVGRIYDVEVKNGNTTISHFVPCYRISDNKIGMYETVSGTFYTSNTNTSFTKGGNV